MEEQTINNWLTEEHKRLEESRPSHTDKESLHFEEDKVVSFTVDFSEPFDKWVDPTDEKVIKKIIPVIQEGVEKVLWINVKNPLYSDIVAKGVEGVTNFKVMQTGSKDKTRYTLVKD